jgi:aryl-alcohol dehydrogenase-like predicted oxidoreductase
MEFTHIPPLKQKASRIGLGTWSIGGWMWGGTDEQESIATIHHALDLGINLIDTAPIYGLGVSEEIVGKALKQYGKRSQIILATKMGLNWENPQAIYRDSRSVTIVKEIEASLRRLQTDYVDLYQAHWPDPQTPFSETAEAMHQLLKAGKIRAIGVSNFSVQQMDAFQKTAPIHSLQSPFNLLEREIEKRELAYCLKKKIAVLGYGSLSRGLLSGHMRKDREFKDDDLRKVDPKFQEPRFSTYLKCVKKLQDWANQHYQRPMMALAIRWALDKGVNVALWGARTRNQLDGLEACFGWTLKPSDFEEIDRILQETITSPIGPEFMAPPTRKV